MAEIQRSKYDELMTDPEFRDLFIKTMDADHAAEVARLEAENKRLRDALQNVVDGNDLALEYGQSIENWRDSAFRKQAIAALAGGKGEDDGTHFAGEESGTCTLHKV